MDFESEKPYILTEYPNKSLVLEYSDGSRKPADKLDLLTSMLSDDKSCDIQKRDYLYKDLVRLSITSLCNCRCLHCFESDADGKMSGSLSLEQLDDILDQCHDIGIRKVDLTGGEPFMHPQFKDILRLIRSKDMILHSIYTNGMLIDEDFILLLRELDMDPLFCISFDGIGTHDAFRGVPGMEKKVTENMLLLKNSGYNIRCNININRITQPTVIDTARYVVKNYNADLFLLRTSPSPRWVRACPNASLSYEEYYDVCLDIIKTDIYEKWGVEILILHMVDIPHDLNMKPVFDAWHDGAKCPMTKSLISHCPKANYMLSIVHDGRVLPCEAYAGVSLDMGFLNDDSINVLKRPLKEILTDSEYRKIYDMTLNDLAAVEPECRDCRWLYICKGGCRLLSVIENNQIRFDCRSKPNCIFFKGGYAQKLEALFDLPAGKLIE